MMRSNLNQADLSSFLASNNAASSLFMDNQQLLGNANGAAQGSLSGLDFSASIGSNPSLIGALFLQAEEQKKKLVAQQLALLQGVNAAAAAAPAGTTSFDHLSLLLQQKSQLQALQSLNATDPSSVLSLLQAAANSSAQTHAPAALARSDVNLPSHGGFSQQQLDALSLSTFLQGKQQGAVAAAAAGSGLNLLGDANASLPLPQLRRRKGRTGTFPQKLHQMLADLENQEGGSEIASFLPHGRAFAIHKPRDFVKHVMPKYFRMSRFSSFQRQLNLYDFHRITEGPDKGSYYHELFVQGRPVLSTMMKRNKIKGIKKPNSEMKQEEDSHNNEDAYEEDVSRDS